MLFSKFGARSGRAGVVALALALTGALAGAAPALSAGLTADDLRGAYRLPSRSPVAQTIAVVVAYDAPTAAKDLNSFTTHYGIPACTTSSGCLRKVNQRGDAKPLPAADTSGGTWIAEATLGLQVARAMCENCRLLLVEADSDNRFDLATAVTTAVKLGADEVSTSYVQSDDGRTDGSYTHPGVAITAASGDDGYGGPAAGVPLPATVPGVVAVGGTQLKPGPAGTYGSEAVWDDPTGGASGSGCSAGTTAGSWQLLEAASVGCENARASADISAAASPGFVVYTSTPVSGLKGWLEAAGTSFSSPLIASVFALAGGVPAGKLAPQVLYENLHARKGGLHDVTRGSNGDCLGKPICTARKGYDGPTGMGTPSGLAAFRTASSPAPVPIPPGTAGSSVRLNPRKPRLLVRAVNRRVRFSSRGTARLAVFNYNRFPVRAKLRIRTTFRVRVSARRSARRRVTLFTSKSAFGIVARGHRSVALRLSRSGLALLRRYGTLTATVTLSGRDAGGRSGAVIQHVFLKSPGRG